MSFYCKPSQGSEVSTRWPWGDCKEIKGKVYLKSVPSEDEGRQIASKAITEIVNRLAYMYVVAITEHRCTDIRFEPEYPQPGVAYVSPARAIARVLQPRCVRGLNISNLEAELADQNPTGKSYFGLFRSALQSASPVERFVHTYHLLLMVLGDSQNEVDEFIRDRDPAVPQSQHPKKNRMETVYTRLRNELAHPERNVPLDEVKKGMAEWVDSLSHITKQAIASGPN